MTMYNSNFVSAFILCLVVTILNICNAQDLTKYLRNVRNCFYGNESMLCVKEETLHAINETTYSDVPINLFDNIQVVRDKESYPPIQEETLPLESSKRSMVLTDAIYKKIEEFVKSRIIQFKMGDAVEARKKGGGGGFGGGGKKGGGGGMIMLIGVAMAGMLTQLFMGKIAFMAGGALLLSKIALLLSLLCGLKKSSGDGGGGKEAAHVVYAGGDSYGHGGWHRSLTFEEDPQKVAYNAYANQQNPYR